MPVRVSMAVGIGLCVVPIAWAQPVVKNGSFEADKFDTYPGLARLNGGKITGWRFEGSVGVNPWWRDVEKQRGPMHSFTDNGRFPHGRQVALMQNACTLSQTIAGFEAGKRYRVTYHENGRYLNVNPKNLPQIKVTLGGELIVSLHPVAPVERGDSRTLPFDYVESAPFTAPKSGPLDLVFTTTVGTRVTVFVDKVEIAEIK